MAPHVTVCVCTCERPDLLARLLRALEHQRTEANSFTFSVVVCDNDANRSAELLVQAFASKSTFSIVYCAEPRRNIALARNHALEHARGEYVAWIDDDEFPEPAWLCRLFAACTRFNAAAVLGPVRPHFDLPPPRWLIDGRFCERPEYPTGTVMHWSKCRTGNVLVRRDVIATMHAPFRAEFGTGGEDVDFFRRMESADHAFVWCNEAVVHEVVPPNRWTRTYMLKRALLRGRCNLKLCDLKALGKSVIAVPGYCILLPAGLLFGQHVFMRYCIKCCDHLGRLLALLGANPVKQRPL